MTSTESAPHDDEPAPLVVEMPKPIQRHTSDPILETEKLEMPKMERSNTGTILKKPSVVSRSVSDSTVRFGTVQINEHAVVLGSHPDVREGLPIELGWKAVSASVVKLDVFEELRAGTRLDEEDLYVTPEERLERLREEGVTEEEMTEREEETCVIQESRQQVKNAVMAKVAEIRKKRAEAKAAKEKNTTISMANPFKSFLQGFGGGGGRKE